MGSLGQVDQGGEVAFFAHVGGFVGGLLLIGGIRVRGDRLALAGRARDLDEPRGYDG